MGSTWVVEKNVRVYGVLLLDDLVRRVRFIVVRLDLWSLRRGDEGYI